MSDIGGKRGRVRKYERYLLESYMVDSEDAIKAYEAVVRQCTFICSALYCRHNCDVPYTVDAAKY